MREIKFRAYHKADQRLFQVDSLRFDPYSMNLVGVVELEDFGIAKLQDNEFLSKKMHSWKLEDVALMQFTGLNDKNGKEIYEGDIFSHPEYIPPVKGVVNLCVGFKDGMFQCGHGSTPEWWVYALKNFNEEAEVIGNIYENGELLSNNPKREQREYEGGFGFFRNLDSFCSRRFIWKMEK